nr:heme-copper oxidase subunit III [Catenulispora acidiphila]
MATATATTQAGQAHRLPNRPNLVSVGTIVWLSSELMFFAALFAMYFTIRSVHGSQYFVQQAKHLNMWLAGPNTTILVLSSVTCQMGVFAAERGDVRRLRFWFMITFVMGSIFVAGQVWEYSALVKENLSIGANAWTSVFYLTTGFHGMHVTGGLLAFLLVLGRTYLAKRFTHDQATSAIVVSYYWHFVDVVWLGLFFVIYIMK